MVNFRDPAIITRCELAIVKLWHTMMGIYLWEFFTTLDYEWRAIRGRIPYRWTIWVYSLTRMSALTSVILNAVGMNVIIQIGCQPWFSSLLVSCYMTVAGASTLIVLRIIAIWNRNKVVMVTAISVWVINVAFLIQDAGQTGLVQLRSEWTDLAKSCSNPATNTLTLLSITATDIALLLIMLVGLLRLRRYGGGLGLTNLLWKHGIIWTSLAVIVEVPPVVFILLNLNDQLNIIFQNPALIVMAIAATRLHRSLVDYAYKSSNIEHDHHLVSGLVFAKSKQTNSMSFPRGIEVSMDIKRRPALQMGHDSPSIDTDDEVHENAEGLHLDNNLHGSA